MSVTPFDIDNAEWNQVSRKLISARSLVAVISFAVPTIVGIVLGITVSPWLYAIAGAALALLVWALWLIRRQVPAIGYAELEHDLAVRRGIMFRNLILVPYGRMQYIEVDSGPLARKYGIATVTLHTAAVADATIPGLPREEAGRLRDRLSQRSESRLAGL